MAQHIYKRQTPRGLFSYEYDFSQHRFTSKTNIVRQAGALYALADHVSHIPFRQESVTPIEKGLKAFANSLTPEGEGALPLSQGGILKPGAGALALLASLHIEPKAQDKPFIQALETTLMKGLLALQKPNGGFASSAEDSDENPYANGEIWFALATYAQKYPANLQVKTALALADTYMMTTYPDRLSKGFFHWGALAASMRYVTTQQPRYATFLTENVRLFLARNGTTPTYASRAYLVEGLASAAPWLTDKTLQDTVIKRIYAENERTCTLQILPGQTQLVSNGQTITSPDISTFAGAILNSSNTPKTRIDYTQHALGALWRTTEMEAALKKQGQKDEKRPE